jgi:hypothetical protein
MAEAAVETGKHSRKDGPWVDLLKTEGPDAANSALATCITAEILLIQAVEVAGIDWCLARLHQAQDAHGKLDSCLDIVLNAIKEG